MQDGLKEKYNIFKGVVGLFESKLGSTLIVTLLLTVFGLFIENRSLHKTIDNNKDKMYEMVIEEVRKQTLPVKQSQKEVSEKIDTMRKDINGTLIELNKQVIKKNK